MDSTMTYDELLESLDIEIDEGVILSDVLRPLTNKLMRIGDEEVNASSGAIITALLGTLCNAALALLSFAAMQNTPQIPDNEFKQTL